MTAFFNHLAYDFRTGLRDKSLMLMNYLFPLFFYVLMGLLMGNINPGYRETMVPASILVAMMAGMVLGLPNPVVAARDSGIFRSFKINGVPAFSIVIIPVLGVTLHMLIVSAIITLTSRPFFGGRLPVDGLAFVGVLLASALALAGAGMLIGVIASNSRATVLLGQTIFLPSMILGGVMMPSSLLPEGLKRVAMLLPTGYAMSAFNGFSLGLEAAYSPLWSVVILLAGGLIALSLAVILFQWDSHNKRRLSPYFGFLALLPYLLGALLLG